MGQQVRLRAEAFDLTATARIERVAPRVDTETGTVKVTLAVSGHPALRPGTFVRVDVVIDTHTETLVVQRSALVPEGRRWHLFRVDETGNHVERLEIRRSFEEGDLVEIAPVDPQVTLNDGDSVVVVGATALSDGVRVDSGDSDDSDDSDDSENDGTASDAS